MLADQVCYTGSVSKLLAPALRVGWLIAPPTYREDLIAAKRNADLGNAVLPQLVLARLMDSGEMERQLRYLRRRHRVRRDAMIDAIATHLPGALVHGAAAGMHLLITFDAAFADVDLAAASPARGVKVQPLSWHSQHPQRPGLVLGYAANTPSDIQAISRPARVEQPVGAALSRECRLKGVQSEGTGGLAGSAHPVCDGEQGVVDE